MRSLSFITLDRAQAEDAAQDAFLQVYLHWNDAPPIRDPAAWLYRVGMNRCKDHRRALRRGLRLIERLSLASPPDPPWAWSEPWSPETHFVEVVGALPKRQRTAAALHYLAGFTTSEIAVAMNISEGAVGSHLHKARESLRKALERGP